MIDLLKLPGFFLCKRASCKMSLKVCINRQRKNRDAEEKQLRNGLPYLMCDKCRQGGSNFVRYMDFMVKVGPNGPPPITEDVLFKNGARRKGKRKKRDR